MALDDVPRCQHVKVNGTQCGSPALRRRRLCFFHDNIRSARAKIAANASERFALPLLEDANSVQVALMKIIQMLGSGTIDHKTAGLMLYALQTASYNLRNTDFEVDDVTEVVIDTNTVAGTCIEGPQWFEDDFESDEEEDGEEEDAAEIAADAEEPAEDIPASVQSASKPPARIEINQVNVGDQRKPVQSDAAGPSSRAAALSSGAARAT